jgi:hypothetical protein
MKWTLALAALASLLAAGAAYERSARCPSTPECPCDGR